MIEVVYRNNLSEAKTFLMENNHEWFTSMEIGDLIGMSLASSSSALTNLYRLGYLDRRHLESDKRKNEYKWEDIKSRTIRPIKSKMKKKNRYVKKSLIQHSNYKRNGIYVPIKYRKKYKMKNGDLFEIPIRNKYLLAVIEVRFHEPSHFCVKCKDLKEMKLNDNIEIDFSKIKK